MRSVASEMLGWLHDSIIENIVYEPTEANKVMKLFMRCPDDSGHPEWQGKNIVVILDRISALEYMVWSVHGEESLDAIRHANSPAFREKTQVAKKTGPAAKNLELLVSFTSGSYMEVLCEDIQIDVLS